MKLKMKKRTVKGEASTSQCDFPTEDDRFVAEILLDLSNPMSIVESLADCGWKCKRRRSGLEPAPPSVNEIRAMATPPVDKDGSSSHSPDMPFNFPTGDESDDEKMNRLPLKRRKNNCLDEIQALCEQSKHLRREIERAKKNYMQIKSYNSQLKKIKREFGIQSTGADQTTQCPVGPMTAQCRPSNYGPIGGFDLNMPAQMDKEDRCAEARWNRIKIMKSKRMYRRSV